MVSFSRFYPLALLVAWLVCGVVAVENPPWLTLPPTPSLPAAASSGLLDINGVQIWHALFSTHLASAGPTVVFLHGGLGHSEYFGLQVAEIAQYRQVLSIDSRGHGRSSRDNTPFSYELMESDVIAVMDHFGLGSADIVGWSDGAIIGLVMARDHPARLNSLFSFAANSNPSGVLDVSTSTVFNDYVARCGVEYAQLSPTPTEYDSFVGNISLMWASQPSITASNFAAMSSNTTHPIWIVDGDHEEAINRTDTLFIADSNPQFALVLLPRVSHFAFIQDPNTFTNQVKNWLRINALPAGQPTQQACTPSSSASTIASSIATLVVSALVAGYVL